MIDVELQAAVGADQRDGTAVTGEGFDIADRQDRLPVHPAQHRADAGFLGFRDEQFLAVGQLFRAANLADTQFAAGDLATLVAGEVGAEAVAAEQADIDRAAACARPFHVFQEIDQVGGLQLRFRGDFAEGRWHREGQPESQCQSLGESLERAVGHDGRQKDQRVDSKSEGAMAVATVGM